MVEASTTMKYSELLKINRAAGKKALFVRQEHHRRGAH